MSKRILTALFFMALCGQGLLAQGSGDYKGGLKIKFDEEGNRYLRFIIWNQIWARYIQNNPGTQVNGMAQDNSFDLGARRVRMLAYAQISPRYLIVTHFGINNQTFINGGVPNGGLTGNGGNDGTGKKPGLFFHDFWNEYAILPQKEGSLFSLYAGAGLHYWNGVSRMANASTLNFMTVDAPIFNWYNIDISDQFARQFGIYVKGKLEKLDYRLSLNRPFMTNQAIPTAGGAKVLDRAIDNNTGHNPWAGAGYVSYQFLGQESNLLPYAVGTYVGTKKVFNIGAGFYHAPKGTASWQLEGSDTVATKHAITNLGVDVFADIPFGGEEANWAFTGYGLLASYNYGPNYRRNVGIMNIGAADASFTGQASSTGYGNSRPLMGTGLIAYTQLGLLLPKTLLPNPKHRLQVFTAFQYMDLEYLDSGLFNYDAGLTYFLDGHHAKFTLQYSNRPLIINNKQDGSRGELILQAQIYL